ncbi:MAG: hypothetical protein RI932_1831 [Pseudomonadota bacterium]|jgi:hypothetical protein
MTRSSGCFRIVCESELDPSLAGFLGLQAERSSIFGNAQHGLQINLKTHADALAELENSTADIAIVSLDRLVEHTSRGQSTQVRILGVLLAGDVRGFVELQPIPNSAGRRLLGSVHPEIAESRWHDLSCGLDINSDFDVGKRISPTQIDEELFSGRFGLMELNMHWEGLLGFRRGLVRRSVWSREFGFPHGLSHVLVVNCDFLRAYPEAIQALREQLMRIYDWLLNRTHSVAKFFADEKVFSRHPDCSFLQASFRILGPHFEGFLQSSGKLEWSELEPYVRWVQSRVAHKKSSDETPFTAIQLEQLLCDAWG